MPEFDDGTVTTTDGMNAMGGGAFFAPWDAGELDNQVTTARDAELAERLAFNDEQFREAVRQLQTTTFGRATQRTGTDIVRTGVIGFVEDFMKPKGKDRSEKTFKLRL